MRIYGLVSALYILSTFICGPPSQAQKPQDGSCRFPLVVSQYVPSSRSRELVKNLTVEDLSVLVGGAQGTLKSMTLDSGPKRVAIVLDASGYIPHDEWELEAQMAASLVENARPEDRFTLLFVGSNNSSNSFLAPSDMTKRLRQVAQARPPFIESDERIYDTLSAATNLLAPPEFGDTVFIFGHPNDSGSKTDPDKLVGLLLKNGVTLIGFSFSDPLQGKIKGSDLNKPLPPDLRALAFPKLAQICAATGYFLSFHSVLSLSQPGQSRLMEGFLGELYASIAEPYRLEVPAASIRDQSKLEIIVKNASERNIRTSDVHYPRVLYPCTRTP